MAHITEDRVLETSTTTGTGALTLAGAVTGFRAFGAVMTSPSDTCWYSLWAVDSNGNATGDFEEGLGTYSGANTLTRTAVLRSSNANVVVTLAAGTKYVALSLLAPRVLQLDNNLAALLPVITAEPSTPAASTGYLYLKEFTTGLVIPKFKGPDGADLPLQPSVQFNRLAKISSAGAGVNTMGCVAPTTTGSTISAVTPASGSAKAATPRSQFASGATAGNVAPLAFGAGGLPMMRGGVNGEGGFLFVVTFALNQQQAANRGFWGICDATAVATNIDPTTSTTNGKVGIGMNSNTGNLQLIRNVAASAPTVTDLGANFPVDTTSLYELLLFCRPHNGTSAGDIAYRIRRYTTNSNDFAFETTGTLNTNIPAATTIVQPWCFMTNNATAAAVQWHLNQLSVFSDW